LIHRARVELRHFVPDQTGEGVIEEPFAGLPTAAAAVPFLVNGNQGLNATEDPDTAFFALAMNGAADNDGSDAANVFEVAIGLGDTFDPTDPEPVLAFPRSRVPESASSPSPAVGIEGLVELSFFGSSNQFLAVQPSRSSSQPCEIVAYAEGQGGVSIDDTFAISTSTASRYDSILPNPLSLLGVSAGSGGSALSSAVVVGVRPAKPGIGEAGLFFASPAPDPDPPGGEVPPAVLTLGVECDLAVEEALLVAPGFLAANPEILTVVGFPIADEEDVGAAVALTQLDANRVAIRFSLVDADGEPIALLSFPGVISEQPLAIGLTLRTAGSGEGAITITDAFGNVIEGDVTIEEDGTVEVSFEQIPAVFAGGVADQSCENAAGQLIIELEGGVQAFELLAGTLAGGTVTATFTPGGGVVVKIAGGCALDPGAGLAGLLGLGPLGAAIALLLARGAGARTERRRARRAAS
jgi:hypothetical protein